MQQNIRWGHFTLSSNDDSPLAVMGRLKEVVRKGTEYVVSFYLDGSFGYYCSNKREMVRLSKLFGWLLDETRIDASGILTGYGYYPSEQFAACFWQCSSPERSIEIENILDNTWSPLSYDGDYFPHNIPFRHFEKDSCNCYFLYDYYTKNSKHERTDFDKRARNLIYRMKEGAASHDAVQRLAYAINEQFGEERKSKNHLIVPIPASDYKSSYQRYYRFCKLLSWYTGINNGYDAVEVMDEKLYTNLKSKVNLQHLDFKFNKLAGKAIYLIDDVYTTGGSFSAMAEELKLHGVSDITGIFLAKTNFDE